MFAVISKSMSERTRKRSRKAEEGLNDALDDLAPNTTISVPASLSKQGKGQGLSSVLSSSSGGVGGGGVHGGRKPRKPFRYQLDDTLDMFKMAVIGSQRAVRDGNSVRDGLAPTKFSNAQMNSASHTATTLLSLSGGSTSARSTPRIGNLDGSAGGIVPPPFQSAIHDSARSFAKTLSNPLVRRWIRSEFLYSGVDRGFFLRNEFVECLADMGLARVTRLTRTEWAAVKGRLGRPRVLSKTFLEQERAKLERYRVDMRRVQMSLLPRVSTVDGPFVYFCSKPLNPGQRATCPHPLYRNILSTCTIVTADIKSGSYIVHFDRSSDGSYRMADTDVFPHGDLEVLYPALSSIPLQQQQQSKAHIVDKSGAASSSSSPSHYVPFDTWRLGHDCGHNLTSLYSSLLPAKAIPQGASSFVDRSSLLVITEGTAKSLSSGPIDTSPPPPMVSPTTLALCSIAPSSTPLPAFGQPVRVAISDEAEIVLRAFSAIEKQSKKGSRSSLSSSSSSSSSSNTTNGSKINSALSGSPQQQSMPLALAGSATAAAQALPLLPLRSLGSATAAVVSYAAHCACALSAAHADEMRLSSSLSSILQRKDALLAMIKSAEDAAATTRGGGNGDDSSSNVKKLTEELNAVNKSAEIHLKALRRLARTQKRAADGASTALEASGLVTPSLSSSSSSFPHPRDSSSSSSSSGGGQQRSSLDMSPFVSVAMSSADILASDPTISSHTGLALLQPQAAERIDGVRIRCSHKAAKASARAIRTALTATTSLASNVKPSADVGGGGGGGKFLSFNKSLLDTACANLLSTSATSKSIEDGGGGGGGGVPVVSSVGAALNVLLALQSASDPGCGLSAVEGFVAVQRALSAIAPSHSSNAKLFQDLCAATASLRSLGQL